MGTQSAPRHFRIFLSSPGDVSQEREKAMHFITNELAKRVPHQDPVTCEVIAWDNPFSRLPLLGNETPQESVNKFGRKPSACDIVIVILWSRIGTPFTLEGTPYQSGTEWEYMDARSAAHNPPVLLYKRTENPPSNVDLTDPKAMEKMAKMIDQYQKVGAFFEQVKAEGAGINEYATVADFDTLLRQHLPGVIATVMKEPTATAVGTPVVSPAGPPPGARERYLKALRRECLRIPLTLLGEDPQTLRAVTLDQIFISLQVTQKSLDELKKADHWTHEEDTEPVQALEAIADCKEVVLLGDPGSGKSSLVRHVLANLAKSELEGTEPHLPETKGLLPVFIMLRDLAPRLIQAELFKDHNERRKQLAALVVDQAMAYAEEIGAAEFAESIEQAFVDEEVLLVLDGLDEVPYDFRWLVRDAVSAVLDQYNLRRVIVTCRIRSYTGDSVFQGVPTFTLAKLDETLIASFVDNWYEAQCNLGRVNENERTVRCGDLKEVATRDPLLSLARNPMLLTTMTIIHQKDTVLPKERVKLYDKAVDLLLKRWQLGKGEGAKELAAYIEKHDKKMRPIMERLAFEAHSAGAGDEAADLQRAESIELLSDAQYLGHEGIRQSISGLRR